MPLPLTTSGRRAVFAQETGEAFIQLLELDAPTLSDAIRVCDDRISTVVGEFTFERFPFEITLPEDNGETPGVATLTICNVDRQIVDAVRSVGAGPLTVRYWLVRASDPTSFEIGPFDFTIRKVDFDEMLVTGELRFEDLLNEPYPADTYSPGRFPGLF